jgi:hypothetical protein
MRGALDQVAEIRKPLLEPVVHQLSIFEACPMHGVEL